MSDPTDSAKEAIAIANENISHAQELMSEAHKIMAQQAENVSRETAKFEQRTKILEHVHFGQTIKLNVGGKIYKTTLATLQKDPDSMLAAMFSGRFDVKASEDDGAYFIDRDGKSFRYILNYLRTGELVYPDDKNMGRQLFLEAGFYQIQGIINYRTHHDLLRSVILKEDDQRETLSGWLPKDAYAKKLLYRASLDGARVEDFHQCCDKKGPTLVLIKSGAYVFGGYTEIPWSSPAGCEFSKDDQSFLFTLSNPSGQATKISSDGSGGIKCCTSYGPTFGDYRGYSLRIGTGSGKELQSRIDLGYGYCCPDGADKHAFFSGRDPSIIDELEVFEVGTRSCH